MTQHDPTESEPLPEEVTGNPPNDEEDEETETEETEPDEDEE